MPYPILFLKASIKDQPGFVLYGHPARWHKRDPGLHADPDQVHYHATKATEVQAVKQLMAAHNADAHTAPGDKVAQIKEEAAQIQAKASASSAVTGWKKTMLAGKAPAASQVKAMQDLLETNPKKAAQVTQEVLDVLGLEKFKALLAKTEGKVPPSTPAPKPDQKATAQMAVKQAYGAVGDDVPRDVDGLVDCHAGVHAITEAIANHQIQIPPDVPVRVLAYNEHHQHAFLRAIQEVRAKHPLSDITSEASKNLLDGLGYWGFDGPAFVNGHSLLKIGDQYVDPHLRSGGVPQDEINKIGAFFEKVYDRVRAGDDSAPKQNDGTLPGPYRGEADEFVLHGPSNVERAALVNLDTGQVIGKKSGEPDTGHVDEIPWGKEGGPPVGLLHNHPDGGTLSQGDINQLFTQGYSEIVAVNADGSGSFRASPAKGATWGQMKKAHLDPVDDLFFYLHGEGAFSDKKSLMHARAHCRLLAMQQQGIIRYSAHGSDVPHQKAMAELNAWLHEHAHLHEVKQFYAAIGGKDALGGAAPLSGPFRGRLYHGTSHDFDEYDESHAGKTTDPGWYGAGLSLTPNKGIAQGYADFSASQSGKPAKVITKDVHLKNPLYTHTGAVAFSQAFEAALGKSPPADPRAVTAALRDAGYDGVVVLKPDGKTVSEVTQFANKPKEGDTKTENGHTYVLQGGKWHRADQDAPTGPGIAPAPPDSQDETKPPSHAKLDLIPWDKHVLPDTNVNAKGVNKQVATIKAAAYAGDAAILEGMKFGSNSYGKRNAKLAQTALAALKEAQAQPPPTPPPAPPKAQAAMTALKGGSKPAPPEKDGAATPATPYKLLVDPDKLPPKPFWSHGHDEEAVTILHDTALQGDLDAFASIEVPSNHTKGALVAAAQHPDKEVRAYFQKVLKHMQGLDPSKYGVKKWFTQTVKSVQDISQRFAARLYGVSVKHVSNIHRLGFWISLGNADPNSMQSLVSQEHWLSESDKAKGALAVHSMPKILRDWLVDVKDAGDANIAYRDGKDVDSGGRKTRDVLAAAYQHAVEFEEGTRLTKFISMPSEMIDRLTLHGPGHVFQNPGSMCTSHLEDWDQNQKASKYMFAKGNAILDIVYAKGAKALYNVGIGDQDDQGEVTTLPGQRFMLLSVQEDFPRHRIKLLMLPPDEGYVQHLAAHKKP